MFRRGQLAVHGLAILLGRIEAGISNRGKNFLHHAVVTTPVHPARNQFPKIWLRYALPPSHTSVHLSSFCGFGSDDGGGCGGGDGGGDGGGGNHSSTE